MKAINQEARKRLDELREVEKNLKSEAEKKRKVIWDKIDLMLEAKGLITRDEDGEFPSLQYNSEAGVLIEFEKSDIQERKMQHILNKLELAIKNHECNH